MDRDKDKDEPILIHGESPGRKLLRSGCLIVLVILVLLAILGLGPLHEFFAVLWGGPGPM